MNMYNKKLSVYYDSLFKDKDYQGECDFIKTHIKSFRNLLDVGCGTLNHSLILSNFFEKVTSIDDSEEMIEIALKKNIPSNIEVSNQSLKTLGDKKFSAVISMFNVVNHIESLSELVKFFNKISTKLETEGVFIFDCWNGVACTIEKPNRFTKKKIHEGYHTLLSETTTSTDLFNSLSIMYTKVEVYDDLSKVDEFEYTLRQKLWTPDVLKQILTESGLEIEKIVPKFDSNSNATESDYRLTFICKKI